jgi:hypothetical protein
MQDYNKSVFYFLLLLIIIFFCYVLLNIHLKCSIYNIYYYIEKKQREEEKKERENRITIVTIGSNLRLCQQQNILFVC